ncbi:MAG: PA14 domain-containing protein, partial [Planctomycetota bacterium]
GAMAFGGPSPMGYLLIRGRELIVPSGRAFPARFDLDSGTLVEFEFGYAGHGSRPGGWFVATDDAGQLVVDPGVNTETHDAGQQTIGQRDIRPKPGEVLLEQVRVGEETYRIDEGASRRITVGGKTFRFDEGFASVRGSIHTMLAADGKLFVVTREGDIYCFGPGPAESPAHETETSPLPRLNDAWADTARAILAKAELRAGYAVLLGLKSGRLAEELVRMSDYHVIVVDPDARKINALRRRLYPAGLYGERVAAFAGNLSELGFPPYLASLVVSEDFTAAGITSGGTLLPAVLRLLRPCGGLACFTTSDAEHALLVQRSQETDLAGARIAREGPLTLLSRLGPLAGAADYSGRPNFDQRVQAPLGLLWFGDTFHHHKLFYKTFHHETGRGLPTEIGVVDGLMKYATTSEPYGPNPPSLGYHDYLRLLERQKTYVDSYTDVYTGRVVPPAEAERVDFNARDASAPPIQTDQPPESMARKNPLTGIVELRSPLKTYGCDRDPVDYGHVMTYRSGTAAFYDKRQESGTINLGGLRSGCRNNMVPAAGVLTLPSWTGNCTCNYPLFTSLALAPMPEDFEQWSAWGSVAVEAPLERVGINFGAPGDRTTREGTLWLDYPSVGGPSPNVPVRVDPEEPRWFYRHSLWMQGGEGWPWVTASGAEGVRSITIEPVARRAADAGRSFSIRWNGSIRPEVSETCTFHADTTDGVRLWLAGKLLLDNSARLRRGESGEVSASAEVEAGKTYAVVMEYHQPPGERERPATLRLEWSGPSLPRCVVSREHLLTAGGEPGGLSAAYYGNGNLSGPAVLGTDPELDFDWGRERPRALAESVLPENLPERTYTVSLYFAEPEKLGPGQRVFSVTVQGKEALKDFDVVKEAGGIDRGVVRRFGGVRVKDALRIEFAPSTEEPPVVCGLQLVAEGPP